MNHERNVAGTLVKGAVVVGASYIAWKTMSAKAQLCFVLGVLMLILGFMGDFFLGFVATALGIETIPTAVLFIPLVIAFLAWFVMCARVYLGVSPGTPPVSRQSIDFRIGPGVRCLIYGLAITLILVGLSATNIGKAIDNMPSYYWNIGLIFLAVFGCYLIVRRSRKAV